jgi:hypothetical protein
MKMSIGKYLNIISLIEFKINKEIQLLPGGKHR